MRFFAASLHILFRQLPLYLSLSAHHYIFLKTHNLLFVKSFKNFACQLNRIIKISIS